MLSQTAQPPHTVVLQFVIKRKYLLMILGGKSYL